MKGNWIRNSCIFLLLLIIILLLVSQLFNPNDMYRSGKVSERNRAAAGILSEDDESVDVLVLGDSESYTSISPMRLWENTGIPAYVCGQPGQRLSETYYMLKTALKNQSPRVVMIETNALFRCRDRMNELKHSLTEMLKFYFPLFMYHDMWKAVIEDKDMVRVDYKGFQIRDSVDPYTGSGYMEDTDSVAPIPEYVKSYMDDIHDLCDENNIKLILYSAPSPKNYNYSRHNGIAAYAEEKDLPYIDLNLELDTLDINWQEDTCDKGDHLNLSGAHKVTDYIGDYLVNNFELKDMRGTKKYKAWDRMMEKYDKRVNPVIDNIRAENV